ncbi:hypothetical protein [Haloferax sp. Q22]|uniref:hypothetical protein n=1 Tax=Haloferax sp. (strain Q22) TaxID=1526048 RepID=UPI000B1B4971|nr:hypothetical protein [Haloferax sp. Q22]
MTVISVEHTPADDLVSQLRCVMKTREEVMSSGSEDIVLDFTGLSWGGPAYYAPLNVLYHDLKKDNKNVDYLPPRNNLVSEYTNQIKFPIGTSDPTEDYENHIPICRLIDDNGSSIVQTVTSKIWDLLGDYCSDRDSKEVSAMLYGIQEISDNIDQHAHSKQGSVLVQNYPSKEFIDICIADNGVTIPGSYEKYGMDFNDDYDALLKSTDGYSTKNSTDDYRNRGRGMKYATNISCLEFNGEVALVSRNAAIHRQGDGDYKQILNGQYWPGTIFVARLREPAGEVSYQKYY